MIDNRAAAETLGFVLAFALVTTSIAIIYTSGIGGLRDARNAEQVENVERAFDVLAENFEEIRRNGVPSRATEIKLLRGEIGVRSQTIISINVTKDPNASITANPRPVQYSSPDGETNITYENGAVFRTDDGNSLMLSSPGWIVESGERLVLPIVDTTRSGDRASMSGRRTLLVVAQFQNREVFSYESATAFQVNVTINSSRASAWKRYLESFSGFNGVDTDASDGEITYSIMVKRVYVPQTAIGVELSP